MDREGEGERERERERESEREQSPSYSELLLRIYRYVWIGYELASTWSLLLSFLVQDHSMCDFCFQPQYSVGVFIQLQLSPL